MLAETNLPQSDKICVIVLEMSNGLTDREEPKDPIRPKFSLNKYASDMKQRTHVLKPRGLDLGIKVCPLQDLVPSHAYSRILAKGSRKLENVALCHL
jgi:hypothetical protein